MKKFIRIELEPYEGTDLMCAACGHFRAELAFVGQAKPTSIGIHRGCIGTLHAKHERRAHGHLDATPATET